MLVVGGGCPVLTWGKTPGAYPCGIGFLEDGFPKQFDILPFPVLLGVPRLVLSSLATMQSRRHTDVHEGRSRNIFGFAIGPGR